MTEVITTEAMVITIVRKAMVAAAVEAIEAVITVAKTDT
jgi:hypothetical protein